MAAARLPRLSVGTMASCARSSMAARLSRACVRKPAQRALSSASRAVAALGARQPAPPPLVARLSLGSGRHLLSTTAGAAAGVPANVLTAEGTSLRVGVWIMGCGATVFGMVVLGGVTRLTHSGLSMTEWRLQGTKYPASPEEWEVEFAKYRRSPEFYMLRPDMTLEEFKPIFWYEWAHRMLGRSLGLIFAVPAAYFGVRGYIRRPLVPRLAVLFALGGMQGLVGWWMVRSGLEIPTAEQGGGYGGYDIPRVSPYRLASHLSTAFVIYAGIVWTGLTVLRESPLLGAVSTEQLRAAMRIRLLAMPLGGLVAVTAVSGAFVAGMQAGHHFNTFPLMDGRLVPEGYGSEMKPCWRNFFEHIPTVQFDHRLLATSTALSTAALWAVGMRQGRALPPFVRIRLHAMLAMTGVQFSLGIVTLLSAVPVHLGSAHQTGALTLFTIVLWTLHVRNGTSARPPTLSLSSDMCKCTDLAVLHRVCGGHALCWEKLRY